MRSIVIPPRLASRRMQRGFFTIDQYRSGAGGGGGTDPYFSSVVHLCHFESVGSPITELVNSCPRGNNMVLTNTLGQLDTSRFVFGTTSLRRNSSAGTQAASATAHSDYLFGTSDFTVEFHYRVDTIGTHNILDMRESGADGRRVVIYTTNLGSVRLYVSSADRITASNGTMVSGTWYAVCACRVSGTTRLFVNGTQVGSSWSDSTNYDQGAQIYLGGFSANPTNANWDELRITNGVGRYSANYTVATEAFPDS